MITFIPYTEGKTYDPAHLRPFDLELAKAGHPLAEFDGSEVRYFRSMTKNADIYAYDVSARTDAFSCGTFESFWKEERACFDDNFIDLRLAPLAIKHDPRTGKDEPLHVGDVIDLWFGYGADRGYRKSTVTVDDLTVDSLGWRWPLEVKV